MIADIGAEVAALRSELHRAQAAIEGYRVKLDRLAARIAEQDALLNELHERMRSGPLWGNGFLELVAAALRTARGEGEAAGVERAASYAAAWCADGRMHGLGRSLARDIRDCLLDDADPAPAAGSGDPAGG